MAGKETGVVCAIENEQQFGEKNFRVRVFVIEQKGEKWTNFVPFQLTGDSCDKADDLNEGDKIEVTYKLAGRKYQKDSRSDVRYFLNAEATSYRLLEKSAKAKEEEDDSRIPF